LHAAACSAAAKNREVLVQYVLAKRGPIVYCAVMRIFRDWLLAATAAL
jgi:hypothetical protein